MTGAWRQESIRVSWVPLHLRSRAYHLCTHTYLTAIFLGLPRVSWYQKGKTDLDFIEAGDSGISWAIYKFALCSRQITMPAPHHLVFYRPDVLSAAQPTALKH